MKLKQNVSRMKVSSVSKTMLLYSLSLQGTNANKTKIMKRNERKCLDLCEWKNIVCIVCSISSLKMFYFSKTFQKQ